MRSQILLVEDCASVADIMATYLTLVGYRVQRAQTAAEALAYVANSSVDLAILDVRLPGRDGFTLCEEMQKAHELPIIMMMDLYSLDESHIQTRQAGAVRMLHKPFQLEELEQQIVHILQKRWPSAGCASNRTN
jgi:DNA-binding response OmpR family regulator